MSWLTPAYLWERGMGAVSFTGAAWFCAEEALRNYRECHSHVSLRRKGHSIYYLSLTLYHSLLRQVILSYFQKNLRSGELN